MPEIIDPFADETSPEPVSLVNPELTAPQELQDVRETPEQRRIRELEAKVAAMQEEQRLHPVTAEGRPVPEKDLTPEQRRIRDLEDMLARQAGSQDVMGELDEATGERKLLLHFLADGITALGRVWYRGQELEFVIPSKAYEDTKDRFGHSWLDLVDNEMEQARKWGEIKFRRGPWPGDEYQGEDASMAALAERERNRRAPVLPV